MTLSPLTIACPQCGSNEVVYSCKPECCFNHVCGNCYTTFEPVTSKVGEFQGEIGEFPPDPDPAGPTAPCARCGEYKLFTVVENGTPSGKLLCISCNALLTLELSEIVPGQSP
jgi:transcription elongation factor Elf1